MTSEAKSVALQEVATIERDVVEASCISDGTVYVGLENIQSGGGFVDIREVEKGELASSKFAFTGRHLLYGKLRPYLAKIARPTFDGICSTDILPVLPGPKLDRDYLAHFLLRPESVALATSRATGANLPRLSPRTLADMRIPLPRVAEQRRIAAILDQSDALRAKRRAAIAGLETLTEAIFREFAGEQAVNGGNSNAQALAKHLLFVTSGSRGWARFYASTGKRFIRSSDVQMNYLANDDIALVAAPDNSEARRTRVKSGDVLLTITGSRIGRVAPVPDEFEGSYISQHVAILRADPRRIDPNFLSYFLSLGTGGQRQIVRAQYGQTKPGLNLEQIKRFEVPVPPIGLQREFARRAGAVARLRGVQEASLARLDALFASLQDRAFRGEL